MINNKLIEYLPNYLHDVKEFNAIFDAEDLQFKVLFPLIESIFDETIIMNCSEERLSQWEQALGVEVMGTLEERRYYVKALLRGNGKLNEAKIKTIVEAFTGGDAIVTFEDSTLIVKVLPPNNGEVYRFPDVERALKPLIPAHIGLSVVRHYSTWGDIKNSITSWEAVSNLSDWDEVRNWIKEGE